MGDHGYYEESGDLYDDWEKEALIKKWAEEDNKLNLQRPPNFNFDWSNEPITGRIDKQGQYHFERKPKVNPEHAKRAAYLSWLYEQARQVRAAGGAAAARQYEDMSDAVNDAIMVGGTVQYNRYWERQYNKTIYDESNYVQEDPIKGDQKVELTVDQMLRDELNKAQFAQELAVKKQLLNEYGIDDYASATVIGFSKKFKLRGEQIKEYFYAAIKCNGKWYCTGTKENRQYEWADLVLFLIGDDYPVKAEEVRVMTQRTSIKDHATSARALLGVDEPKQETDNNTIDGESK